MTVRVVKRTTYSAVSFEGNQEHSQDVGNYTKHSSAFTRALQIANVVALCVIVSVFIALSVFDRVYCYTDHDDSTTGMKQAGLQVARDSAPPVDIHSLPQDFHNATHKVAVSSDGKSLVIAMPSAKTNGVYLLREDEKQGHWNSFNLVKDYNSLFRVAALSISLDGSQIIYAGDHGGFGRVTLSGYKIGSEYPETSQSPFPRATENTRHAYFLDGELVVSKVNASRILLHEGNMVIGVYAEDKNRIFQRVGEIPCSLFGEDCEPSDDNDDTYALTYSWCNDDTNVAVIMCSMRRCTARMFKEQSGSWVRGTFVILSSNFPLRNYALSSSQGKMVATSIDGEKKALLATTWSSDQDTSAWQTELSQTFPLKTLHGGHYYKCQKPILSHDGTVLGLVVDIEYVNRPVVRTTCSEFWLFHWKDSSWTLQRKMELTPMRAVQVEMTGNGQRLFVFKNDLTFSVVAI